MAARRGKALNEVFAHLDKQSDLAVPAAHLRCQTAVKMKDKGAMGACTAVLAKAAPDDPKTIVFQWSYAVMRGEREEAAALVNRAQQAGVALDGIEQMKLIVPSRWASPRLLGVATLGGAVALLAVVFFRRRLTTRRA